LLLLKFSPICIPLWGGGICGKRRFLRSLYTDIQTFRRLALSPSSDRWKVAIGVIFRVFSRFDLYSR
jgi:hypothetical protein